MFLLDTAVISELRKPDANPHVVRWAGTRSPSCMFISAITLMELESGVLHVERSDPAQGARLRAWLDQHVAKAFAGRILAVDAAVVRRRARLQVSDPRSECAALIAATALVHGFRLVTGNAADFQPFKVQLLNPWVSQLHEEPGHYSTRVAAQARA